jgi:hypothetical protein
MILKLYLLLKMLKRKGGKMRTPLYLIALSISDVAKSDLSDSSVVVLALFILFFSMDVVEFLHICK